MQQSSATPKNQRCRDWVVAYSHSSSQCLLVSTVFGMVSLMIFILVSPYFLCRLSLDCSARRDDVYVRTRMRIVRANQNGVQSRKMASVKTEIAAMVVLSEGQRLPYYTKGTSCTKIRPPHVKIIVFRPLIWGVDRLY